MREDSLFSAFASASDLRYRTGESTFLEKANAESRLASTQNRLRQNALDLGIARSHLAALVASTAEPRFADTVLTARVFNLPEGDAALAANPELLFLKRQIDIADRQTEVSKAQRLPDLRVGYFNQSIIGAQDVDGSPVFYGGGKRFQGATAGVSVPIFGRAGHARVDASRIAEQVAGANFEAAQTELQGHFRAAAQEYRKQRESLDFYEKTGLPQAELILKQASSAWQKGEIGYLEYGQNVALAREIEAGRLAALRDFNAAVIQLQFILGN